MLAWDLDERDRALISAFDAAVGIKAATLPLPQTIIAAGIAVVAADTGRVLLMQRAYSDLDDPARGRWEFPGGRLEDDERPIDAAAREWKEETGLLLPSSGRFVDGWHSPDGVYALFIFRVENESDLQINPAFKDRKVANPDDPTGEEVETQAWFEIDDLAAMPQLRDEVRATPWHLLKDAVPEHVALSVLEDYVVAGMEFAPANVSAEQRRKWAKTGVALPDGSFPIPNKDFLKRAIQAIGRAAESKRASVRRHIIKRARALGATDLIPDEWKDNAMTTTPPLSLRLDLSDLASSLGMELPVTSTTSTNTLLPDTVELTEEDFHWRALLLIEGIPTGDGRTLHNITGHRELPLPFMLMRRNPEGGAGHAGAEISGRIDLIEKVGDEWWGEGIYDRDSEAGREAARLNKMRMIRGVSVDLDGPPTSEMDAFGNVHVSNGRIMGATQCPFAAFAEAQIKLPRVEHDPMLVCPCKALKADDQLSADDDGECGCGGPCCSDEGLMALVASGAPQPDVQVWTPSPSPLAAVVASGAPVAPPAEWFELPGNAADLPIHPVRMASDGRISGFAAMWGDIHLGDLRTTVPRAGSRGYDKFHTGQVQCADGTIVQTGPIFMGGDHPDVWLTEVETRAAYGATSTAVGDIRVYETPIGLYCCGAARPEVTDLDRRRFNGSDGASPDWRPIRGRHELVAMLIVNMSAYKVPAMALVASGAPSPSFRIGYDVATGEFGAIVGRPPVETPEDVVLERLGKLETFCGQLQDALVAQLAQAALDAAFEALPDPAAEEAQAALDALESIPA
jgi:8-oxo-dGTP pyrophosphatase MutT (NUDIX family)